MIKQSLYKILVEFVRLLFALLMKPVQRADYACYFPAFESHEALVNHYFRARWYLPAYPKFNTRVSMFTTYGPDTVKPEERPPYLCEPVQPGDHILIGTGKRDLWRAVLCSKEILLWKPGVPSKRLAALLELMGKRVSYIATEDTDGREYAVYASLLWNMLSDQERQQVKNRSRGRFNQYAEQIRQQELKKAYAFGNGPSLEKAYEFDFSDGVRIMANSVVKDAALLDHVKPHFLVAGDPVNHFGASTYAAEYRADLLKVLDSRDLRAVLPDFQGFIVLANHPEYAEKIFIVPMINKVPNYNVLKNYWIPMMWSVLNALMLPLAATFADDIYVLGIDGKSKKRDNEDFWAHATTIQYDVNLAHQCHPTFDQHRQAHPEYERVQIDLAHTIILGEGQHGKRYQTLWPSNMTVLEGRLAESSPARAQE